MSARLRVGDRVRVIRGLHLGTTGVVEHIGSRVVGVRTPAPDLGWPFPGLLGFPRADLALIADDATDREEALL